MIFCFMLSVLDMHFLYGDHRTETVGLFHGMSVGYWFWSYFANAVFVNFGLFFVNTEYQKAKVACQQLIILLTFKGMGKILRTVTVLL